MTDNSHLAIIGVARRLASAHRTITRDLARGHEPPLRAVLLREEMLTRLVELDAQFAGDFIVPEPPCRSLPPETQAGSPKDARSNWGARVPPRRVHGETQT